jgi:hypothetical protein
MTHFTRRAWCRSRSLLADKHFTVKLFESTATGETMHNGFRAYLGGAVRRWTSFIVLPVACAALGSGCSGDGEPVSNVSVQFSTTSIDSTPFPSDRFTVADAAQYTALRVNLPAPDCTVRVSDCADLSLINTLDGFNTQPRIAIPFTGDIDPSTVSSDTVFLVRVGDARTGAGRGERVGINQATWEPATKTLFVESDQLLAEHSRYLLVMTDGIHDTQGRRLGRGAWQNTGTGLPTGEETSAYASALAAATDVVPPGEHVIAASLFTTRSATTELVSINRAVRTAGAPAPVDFMIGTQGGVAVRAAFDRAVLSAITLSRQSGTAPSFTTTSLPLSSLDLRGSVIGKVAYGRYRSQRYLNADYYIPAAATLAGTPQAQGARDVVVQVFLPAGARPASGWPVMIFGHGFGGSMFDGSWSVASSLAAKGIATVAINAMGHAGGPLGTLQVAVAGGQTVVIPAGGRSEDLNGDGSYGATEGASAKPPYLSMVGSRDGMRQTVADLFQLVRQIQGGIDVDGDGSVDLDASRIYYAGQSWGGIYGGSFFAVEPAIKAAVLNVAGGSLFETTRLGGFRIASRGIDLAARIPSLINLPPAPGVAAPNNLRFEESIPLRNQPVLVTNVPGATAIAQMFDRGEWVGQSGNIVSYAPLMRKQPLEGVAVRPVILQNAKGDQQSPNPTSTAILRAGDLADRATFYRYDMVYAQNPTLPKDPHGFLTAIGDPLSLGNALAAQDQIATFFATQGTTVIDPDGSGAVFETPVVLPLPETLNYIQ